MEGKQPLGPQRRATARVAALAGWPGVGGSRRIRLSLWGEAIAASLHEAIERETARRTWFNLLPVAFGLGVGLYFAADREPLWWGPPLALALFAALAWRMRARPLARALLVALAALCAGLTAADWRTERVRAPMLERTLIGPLTGFVESVEERTGDLRIVLRVTSLAGLAAEATPARVRITARKTSLQAGEHVALTARLTPPPEPARPGGYDFARDAFFRGVGAVGTGLGEIRRAAAPHPAPVSLMLAARIDEARNAMTERIARLIGGQPGAVAAALVTGKRGLISEETNEVLRAAGLYHIVSISGLHMVLAAGSIFWIVRALLALSAGAALSWPLKKIAAAAAMLGAAAYCIFSGSEVATVRSLIMTLVMLGAVLVDRPALSMRNLAFAALIVLALEPDSLLGPSFQMSFGAVAALIAYAEWSRSRPRRDGPPEGLAGRWIMAGWRATAALFVTSVLAMLATSPFAAFHFQTYNPYGLAGNMLALPFVSLAVMPAAVIGALLYPLGLDAIAWWLMGLATAPVLQVAAFVAGFGGSVQVVPAYGLPAVVLLGAALTLATLLTTWLRLVALLPLGLGLALAANPQRVDIHIDREGLGAAVRAPSGQLSVLGRPSAFVIEQWLRADGDNRRANDPTLRQGAACDPQGCTARLPTGQIVAWSRRVDTVAEDCVRADLVVTPLRWRGACAALIADRLTLDRHGALAVTAKPDGLQARATRSPEGARPWMRRDAPQPVQAPAQAPAASVETEAPELLDQ